MCISGKVEQTSDKTSATCQTLNIADGNVMTEKDPIIEELEAMLAKPGGKQAVRFVLSSIGGAIPFAGGVVSAGVAFSAEKSQQKVNERMLDLHKLTRAEIEQIRITLGSLTAEPTKAGLALLIGEILGDALADQLLTGHLEAVPVVLNPMTITELQPYIKQRWISLQSTGAVCSMGANNRVGNHIEELKHPFGMGNGFVLTIAP